MTPIHESRTFATEDEEPLIGTAVLVFRITLRIARRQHHFGRLRPFVANADMETLPKTQILALHETSRRTAIHEPYQHLVTALCSGLYLPRHRTCSRSRDIFIERRRPLMAKYGKTAQSIVKKVM